MHGNCNYVHVKACMKPVNGITHVQVQDLISYETSINIIYLYWYTNPLSKFNMNIKNEPFFKWYFLSKGSSNFNNPLHILHHFVFQQLVRPCVAAFQPSADSKVLGSTTAELWKKAPDDSESELGGPSQSWLVNLPPRTTYPPLRVYKGLIAGLIKGNQWLRSP